MQRNREFVSVYSWHAALVVVEWSGFTLCGTVQRTYDRMPTGLGLLLTVLQPLQGGYSRVAPAAFLLLDIIKDKYKKVLREFFCFLLHLDNKTKNC
ncbi:MAG: hypothetical protein M3270_00335 [Thermoproteota archaeon]|nr:hypothetical protein [Thermoproteota archaeon]